MCYADLMLEGGELAGLQDAAPPFFLRSAQCRTGLGLLLTYLISDILQVISGEPALLLSYMADYFCSPSPNFCRRESE